MSSPYRPVPPASVPTLTEVVPWPEATTPSGLDLPLDDAAAAAGSIPGVDAGRATAAPAAAGAAAAAAVPAPAAAPAPAPAPVSEAQLTQEVLAELQRRIDLMLEVRLREALAPILARTGDALIRDARKELTGVLREVVAGAVKQQLRRPDER